MEYKVAIIGPESIISGFKMLGAVAYDAGDSEKMVETYQEIQAKTQDPSSDERYAVVIVMEDLMKHVSGEDRERMTKEALPALVILPGLEGSQGQGSAYLKQLTQKAIGSDIF